MKKSILFLIVLFAAIAVRAKVMYEGSNMLVDGRVWNVVIFQKVESGMTPLNVFYRLDGTEEVDGMECSKLYYSLSSGRDSNADYKFGCYMRQDGDKISALLDGVWVELFDFGLQVGDKLPSNDNVIGRNPMQFNDSNYEFDVIIMFNNVWIVGIGNQTYGPFNDLPPILPDIDNYGAFCIEVLDGGESLFNLESMAKSIGNSYYLAGIEDAKASSTDSGKIFDLHGRRLTSKPEKGVYIEGGRKRVAGK